MKNSTQIKKLIFQFMEKSISLDELTREIMFIQKDAYFKGKLDEFNESHARAEKLLTELGI